MQEWFILSEAWLRESHPLWLFFALVFLPLGPFPVSVLFVLIGVRFGVAGGMAVCAVALILNLSFAFGGARLVGRPLAMRVLGWIKLTLPEIRAHENRRVVLLLRLTPGIPLFMQNYTLGLSGVPFGTYLIFSFPIVFAYAVAFVVFGGALFSGRTGWMVAGVLFAISMIILIKLMMARIRRKAAEAGEEVVT